MGANYTRIVFCVFLLILGCHLKLLNPRHPSDSKFWRRHCSSLVELKACVKP